MAKRRPIYQYSPVGREFDSSPAHVQSAAYDLPPLRNRRHKHGGPHKGGHPKLIMTLG